MSKPTNDVQVFNSVVFAVSFIFRAYLVLIFQREPHDLIFFWFCASLSVYDHVSVLFMDNQTEETRFHVIKTGHASKQTSWDANDATALLILPRDCEQRHSSGIKKLSHFLF